MSKQKLTKAQVKAKDAASARMLELAVQASALGFAALTIVGATELIMEHMSALNPAAGHGSNSISELFSRGEGKNESARMPEEFDIGLQTPHISGL
jgi:hypothetical protein